MRKRNLSEFMSIELLYDYKSGKLDPLRREAVEEALQSSPRVREELKKLSIGMSYCDKLKNVSVSEPLVDLILNEPKPTQRIFSKLKWTRLPQPVRWAFEAVVVAVAIALFVTQMPELFKDSSTPSESIVVKKFDGRAVEEQVEDSSEIQVEVKPEAVQTPVVASKEIPELLKPLLPEEEAKPDTPQVIATAPTPPPAAAPGKTATAVVSETAKETPVKKGNAYVYRMTMRAADVDTITPEIVALITGLGGEKAGEVQLGWRRKGGSYFHFSIPMVNSPALREGLKKYSTFNIVKSAHPRVMPEDTERYILWLERIPPPSTETEEVDSSAGEDGNAQGGAQSTDGEDLQDSPPGSTQETNEEN